MLFDDLKYLWLLAVALIPLIIHLINRGNRSVLNVGSLKWLEQKRFNQKSNLKFQQFTLWFLRTLIFLLISFVVAKPFILKNKKINNRHLLLVKDDVSKDVLANVMDTLTLDEWNIKWLNWDLQHIDLKLENTKAVKAIPPYKAIELIAYSNIDPLSVTVLGSYNQHQLKFKFPDVSFSVKWLLLPRKKENMDLEMGIIERNNEKEILKIEQNEFLAKVISDKLEDTKSDLPIIKFNIDTIAIAFDKKYKPLAKIIDAALKAVTEYQEISTTIIKKTTEELNTDLEAGFLFWLSDLPTNNFKIKNSRNTYAYKEVINKNTFISVNDKLTYFNVDRDSDKIPGLLNEMLFENKVIYKKYNELISQPINSTFFNRFKNETKASSSVFLNDKKNLNNYLVIILLLLIVIERLICWLPNLR